MHELLDRLLRQCVDMGASDLHIGAGAVPAFRLHGLLERPSDEPVPEEDVDAIALSLMQDYQPAVFNERKSLDLGVSAHDSRFRVNVYRERGKTALAVRMLPKDMLSLTGLHLPPQLNDLAKLHSGLVLVCGATGSGKSTTLATLIDEINEKRACHIITIEDPIEFVHEDRRALIHQRELFTDVPSFPDAVRAALREDPDVVLIGELRDTETIRTALTAAETGHLVFSTLHTGDAVGSIERLVGSFPAEEQVVARHRIGMCLRAVVAQHLLPASNGRGRVPAVEILLVNPAISNLIATSKSKQIYSAMEAGRADGLQTLDQSLAELVRDRWITPDQARQRARSPDAIDQMLRGRP